MTLKVLADVCASLFPDIWNNSKSYTAHGKHEICITMKNGTKMIFHYESDRRWSLSTL
jgi:hypothetical protein